MDKTIVITILIAFAMVGFAVFVAYETRSWKSETGDFPNRVFELGKAMLSLSDGPIYETDIHPTSDRIWWLELTALGGSAVEVTVDEIDYDWTMTVSTSTLTEVGQSSEHITLYRNFDYSVAIRYIGDWGTSVLTEHVTIEVPSDSQFDDPITISSDAEFTTENGVVGGSGTESDPYVISGWEISTTERHCIEISYTSAHLIIRDCFIHGDLETVDHYYEGISNIKLSSCSNIVIENVTAIENDIGLNIESCSNVSVSDSDFSGNWYGLNSRYTPDIRISGVTCYNCSQLGIYVGEGRDFAITNSTIVASLYQGIIIYSSSNGIISDNVVSNNGDMGIMILDCGADIEMYRNAMDSDGIFFLNCGSECYESMTLDESNTVGGLPVMFYIHQSGLIVEDISAGQIIAVLCDDLTIQGITLSDCDVGITLAESDSCYVNDCVLTDIKGYGIYATRTSHVNISSCQISNSDFGVFTAYCTDVRLYTNEITHSSEGAVAITNTEGGEVMSCQLENSNMGLWLEGSYGFTITLNRFLDNEAHGANICSTSGCLIYHNDFMGIGNLATDQNDNQWDIGYPGGGNYWSDYDGVDADMDGIGDTPYAFEIDAQDSYPLMSPIT